uniref:Reverse transcriptase domain-containing protein n=1 Tax=Tanacetum cinerariifolium TaxID=118510 RepID=A0A6L2JS01_TANCI|nr:hypothetical protein [Tanacetum cinerariifolium]
MDQNIDSFGFDKIQTPQSPEMIEEVFQAKGNLMKSIQTFLEKFNRIPFGEMPKILLQAWEKFFAIQHAQPEDTNELFQKLLKDLQIINEELAEYINSPSWNHPTFFNKNEDHSVQYKEYLENSSNEIAASNFNQKKENPPQDSDICYLVRKNEVKNVVEQPTKRGTRIVKSLQNFRVKKSSISLNNTSQISLVHAITPVLPTEPEYSLSMGYEHLNTILETESNKVIKSSAKNLLPITIEYEITFDVEISEEDVPMEDFKVYSNPLFDDEEINSDMIDPHCFNIESDLIESLSNRDTLFNSSPKFDYLEEFSGALMSTSIVDEERIRREHEEYISLMEKLFTINSVPRPLENFHANTIVETLSSSTIPVGDGDSLREEIDIFTSTDDLLPPGIESDDYDSEGDIYFLEELLVNDSIPFPESMSYNFDHQDDLSFPCPPPEPPDVEFFFDLEPDLISAMMNNIDELNEDECFDPEGEIDVFLNVEDDDYFPFIFFI